MISYRSDREVRTGTVVVRVSMHRAPVADIPRGVPGHGVLGCPPETAACPPGVTLSRRRAVDFCRVAAAL